MIVGRSGRVTVAQLQKSAPPETSFVADVAAQVVAWHNRHPLARRITRKDVQSVGIVTLPFARPAQPAWNAVTPKRGLLALMFPKRVDRRPWPAFSEDALPDIGVARLAQFALKYGWIERPGPADLPERALQVDRDLLDTPRGRPTADQPSERLDRFLVTAAIDLGPTRPRLVLGRGRRMPLLGQRLWSLPRFAALGGVVLLAVVVGVAGLWVAATGRPGADTARSRATPAAASAAPGASAAGARPASAPAAPAAASAPASAAASISALPAASTAAAAPARAASAMPPPLPPAPSTASAAISAAPSPSAPASVPLVPSLRPDLAASAANPPVAPAATSAQAAAPPPSITQRASAPLVPPLRPDLAASARAEAASHPGLPQRSAPPTAPGARPPGDSASAARVPARFYALVSRPLRSEAEADALLKRLRAETQRIAHPTAIETGLQRTPEGWRVTWWPFTHPRQAENARAALAARRVDLEMVEF
jgi:hypothetical protein